MKSYAIHLFHVLVFICLLRLGVSNLYSETQTDGKVEPETGGTCDADGGPCFVKQKKAHGLVRLDGVKIGHRQEVDLGEDGKRVLITRALKPLLFEIPGFLTDEECNHLISKADDEGMRMSIARGGLTKVDKWKFYSTIRGRADGPRGLHENWDIDKDGRITLNEIQQFARIQRYLHMNESEVEEINLQQLWTEKAPILTVLEKMFHKLNMSELNDGFISQEEFEVMNTMLVDGYMYEMKRSHPRHRQRYSDQAWLTEEESDKVLKRIRERVVMLTGLPEYIVKGSEYLQVAKYGVDGHYHAHYDSETHEHPDIQCCHQVLLSGMETMEEKQCKLCRYITIMYYLNEVVSGGETAFPVVDNATFDVEFLQSVRQTEDRYNLSKFCHKSMLVIKPKRGTAVMWYNHHMDTESGWMGAMDKFSIHGGCAVKAGVKYIANNWIVAPYKHSAHMPSLYLGEDEM